MSAVSFYEKVYRVSAQSTKYKHAQKSGCASRLSFRLSSRLRILKSLGNKDGVAINNLQIAFLIFFQDLSCLCHFDFQEICPTHLLLSHLDLHSTPNTWPRFGESVGIRASMETSFTLRQYQSLI